MCFGSVAFVCRAFCSLAVCFIAPSLLLLEFFVMLPPSVFVLSCAQVAIDAIVAGGADVDLIELRTLKPLDLETIGMSLRRTHKVHTRLCFRPPPLQPAVRGFLHVLFALSRECCWFSMRLSLISISRSLHVTNVAH